VLIRNHQLALPDDEELIDELSRVRLRETSPGVLRLEQDADAYKDRAVTLALAATWLLDHPTSTGSVRMANGSPGITDDLTWCGF
jgi:hypothetical protein